ncbi:HD-GYP domain-containing protein [Bacillus cereus]|uniref:HD-GYP domain-containing protein n=1 Tax=Bacillus cereus TaxID=1396 RepID=UPI0018F2D5A6|nr:HD domain-containing protein [Bacillus cereus]MBJ8003403.1 HD domain-containing protein [Bacillus cereus]
MSKKPNTTRTKEVIVLLFYLLCLKDPYTKDHSKRVSIYATVLAKEAKEYNSEALIKLFHSCLLHDIWKMRIPNKILKKPLLSRKKNMM